LLPEAELACEGHAVQLPGPAAALYSPTTHAAHVPPSAPVKPAEHWHGALPPAVSEFDGHVEHCPVPVPDLNDPGSHAVHAAPSDTPLYPAKHLQEFRASLPDAELVPAGQGVHCPTPMALLYAPTSQDVHAEELEAPTAAEYFPAGQDVHEEE